MTIYENLQSAGQVQKDDGELKNGNRDATIDEVMKPVAGMFPIIKLFICNFFIWLYIWYYNTTT